MDRLETLRAKFAELDLDTISKVELATIFFDLGYSKASLITIQTMESYLDLRNVKRHLRENLEKGET